MGVVIAAGVHWHDVYLSCAAVYLVLSSVKQPLDDNEFEPEEVAAE